MSCPICGKRPPKRFCPAKGEKICAICCGREREVTIDCPSGCPHLVAAHRYEAEHRQPLSRAEFPYADIQFPVDFVYERWPVVTSIAAAILVFQIQHKDVDDFPRLKDSDIFQLLVFLLRLGKQESNGRPRSRALLDFLRARFPLPADAPPQDAPRIVVP